MTNVDVEGSWIHVLLSSWQTKEGLGESLFALATSLHTRACEFQLNCIHIGHPSVVHCGQSSATSWALSGRTMKMNITSMWRVFEAFCIINLTCFPQEWLVSERKEWTHNVWVRASTQVKKSSWIDSFTHNSYYKSTGFMDISLFILLHHLGLWKTSVAQKVLLQSAAALLRTASALHSLLCSLHSHVKKGHEGFLQNILCWKRE